eukprot:jgi/Botrbrau1/11766/Bobra.0195s0091.1
MSVPKLEIGTAKEILKGEDEILLRTKVRFNLRSDDPAGAGKLRPAGKHISLGDPYLYNLFCVFDGHNGGRAATHLQENLEKVLHERMPLGPCPSRSDSLWHSFRMQIQKALVETISILDCDFASQGARDGSTLTVVVVTGWLVTCANVGDSRAYVDAGGTPVQITADHRLVFNQAERHRLESMGRVVAPLSESSLIPGSKGGPAKPGEKGLGPVRVWPGGLCLSRSFGDFDVGREILCTPHIFQLVVPVEGARLIVASDGVWDGFPKDQWLRHARSGNPETACRRIFSAIKTAHQGLKDDTTIIIADILPPNVPYFTEVLVNYKKPPTGCFACMSPPSSADCTAPTPETLVDLDIAALLGYMPKVPPVKPPWFTAEFAEELKWRAEESHRNFEIAFKLAMDWPTEEASQPEVPVADGDVAGASTPEEVEAVARPRRRAHVRFAEEPQPALEIPAVFSGEGLASNGAVDQPPPAAAAAPDTDFRMSAQIPDVSTRMGTRFFDSVVEGRSPERGRAIAGSSSADPNVRGGREFFTSTRGAVRGSSPESDMRPALAGQPSSRLRTSPPRREPLPDQVISARIRDTDPTVRMGTEYFRRVSDGTPADSAMSVTIRDTDPTVRLGGNFSSPGRPGSHRRPRSPAGSVVPDPSVSMPPASVFDISTRLSTSAPMEENERMEVATTASERRRQQSNEPRNHASKENTTKNASSSRTRKENTSQNASSSRNWEVDAEHSSDTDAVPQPRVGDASMHFPKNVTKDHAAYVKNLGPYRTSRVSMDEAGGQRPSFLQRISRSVGDAIKRVSPQPTPPAPRPKVARNSLDAPAKQSPTDQAAHVGSRISASEPGSEPRRPLREVSPRTDSQQHSAGESRVRDGRGALALMKSQSFTKEEKSQMPVAATSPPTAANHSVLAPGRAPVSKENGRISRSQGEAEGTPQCASISSRCSEPSSSPEDTAHTGAQAITAMLATRAPPSCSS